MTNIVSAFSRFWVLDRLVETQTLTLIPRNPVVGRAQLSRLLARNPAGRHADHGVCQLGEFANRRPRRTVLLTTTHFSSPSTP
jgi:hypothetical protein